MSDFDYIIVGSGAGGGPLAANLAKAGFKVLLMEAGGDPCSSDETGRLMYEVPVFHGLSTEYKACAWDYFVRHYSDDTLQARDSKKVVVDRKDTVWYPRAGTLGGCTAHNAMITVVPQDSDWDNIARLTGDTTWAAANMRTYFQRLENCKYVRVAHAPTDASLPEIFGSAVGTAIAVAQNALSSVGAFFRGEDWRDQNHGHGFNGWLPTSEADPKLVLKDPELIALLLKGVKEAVAEHIGHPQIGVESRFDPNDARNSGSSPEGLAFTPLAVENGKRRGPRDFVLQVQKQFPGNLTIQRHSLATRVIFEGTRAVGVEYIDQPHVYRADPAANGDPASLPRRQVRATREIILAGGAFNTPQLLQLSGIGPRAELERFGIPVVADLPGVGENLQDRYEVGVVSDFVRDFALLDGATFAPPDPDPDALFKQWSESGTGVYASNGALIGIIMRSAKALPQPDLYVFGLPGFFRGYQPGYSKAFERHHDRFTWAILKARTHNTGSVRLKTADPWDTPLINFKYFGDGARQNDPDLEAVLQGVRFVRDMNRRLSNLGLIKNEEVPGPENATDDQLRKFIRNEAWGHHASCTAKIGSDDDAMAVLDSRFRVRNTQGLRVVDASVFPQIPGYFIVSAIYMISEKAFDVIGQDAG